MKKSLLSLLIFSALLLSVNLKAQTFTVPSDTVKENVQGSASVYSKITNTSAATGLVLYWHVISSDFPADWLTGPAFGVCDNNTCWNNTGDTAIWNAGKSMGPIKGTLPYEFNKAGTFYLSLNLSSASPGKHWMNVAIIDSSVTPAYVKTVTFVINKIATGIPAISSNQEDKVMLYPNPANNDLNLVFDANADVRNIAVYNVIGKMMNVYKVTGNSANLNIENIPSGIYFVKLYNGNGNVVVTRKFTKQ